MFHFQMHKRLAPVVASVFCSILLLGLSGSAFAQVSGDGASPMLDQGGTNPLLLLRQRLSQGSLTAAGIPLEGAVDPDQYVVGPGDSFTVSVAGQEVTAGNVAVGIDGRIVLPDAGSVHVSGLTLTEARDVMLNALRISFRKATVDVALVQTRQFYVHVSGAVPRPGRYLALPVARVSSVLEFAFADTTALSVSNPAFRPSLRNIELKHRDGSISSVDIIRYYATGDPDVNPYLQDGDVISVPARDPNFGTISVGGYVPFPGNYDFKEGDTLAEMIRIVGGLENNRNVREVRISRSQQASIETHSFTRDEAIGSKGQIFRLKALDVISVAQPDEKHGLVSIEGQVQFPGSYPIIAGNTTLAEVLKAAGGAKPNALLRGAFIERSTLQDPAKSGIADRYQSQSDVLNRMLRSDTTSVMQHMRLTEMNFTSKAYFAVEYRLQNKVSVQLDEWSEDSPNPVYLEPGDRIYIPKDLKSVFVVGQVIQPGFLPIQPGMSAEYYIAAAGGRSIAADEVYIVNPASGSFSNSAADLVQSGDVIFVDRDKPIADTVELQRLVIEENRVRADSRFRTAQTVLQSVATLASAIALIVSLRN